MALFFSLALLFEKEGRVAYGFGFGGRMVSQEGWPQSPKRNVRYLGIGSLKVDIRAQKFKNMSLVQVSVTETLCYLYSNRRPSAVLVMKRNPIFGTTFRKNPCEPSAVVTSVCFSFDSQNEGARHHSATILILSSTSLRVDGCWANSLPHSNGSLVSWFSPVATAVKKRIPDCLFHLLSIHTHLKMNGWNLKINVFAKENHLPTKPPWLWVQNLHFPGCSSHSVGKHSVSTTIDRVEVYLNEFRNKRAIFAVFCCCFGGPGPRTKITNFFLAKSGEIRKDILE